MSLDSKSVEKKFPFLKGGGEAGEIVRSIDWSQTPLGPIENWPQSLCTTLGILLHSAFPMLLFWGEDLICFYNDGMRPSLGENGKHPGIGTKGAELWSDVWEFVGPLMKTVMETGEPVWYEDQLVAFYRNNRKEEIYWTFSYSPAYNDRGEINGVFVTCAETTEKVLMLKKLEESQSRFQNLVRESPIGIVVLLGAEMVVEITNEAYGKLIGKDYRDLLGKPLFLFIPEAEAHFKPILKRVMDSGEPLYLDSHPYFALIGGERVKGFLNLVYQPYREANGAITGVIVLCQDVTSQVVAIRKAESSEQMLRSLIESAPFPIGVYTGKEMRIELANQSIINIWDKGDVVIGKRYPEILPELEGQEIFEELDRVYTSGQPIHRKNQKVVLEANAGTRALYFNYSFTPLFDASGNVYGVMNTAAEVTDLNLARLKTEQSENNFRNIIRQAPVAMCLLIGPEHIIDVTNDLMLEIWGKPREQMINKPVFTALPDARDQGLEKLLDSVYNTGETFTAYERPVSLIRRGKKEDVYQNFVYHPYRDVGGSVLGVIAISVDVTPQVIARQQIEEVVAERTRELAEANNNLQRSNKELEQFAYIASHDLQEPIRKVGIYSQMLAAHLDNADERAKQYLDKINNAASRMTSLVRDVLAYSQLSNEGHRFEQVDLKKIVDDCVSDFELLMGQKHCTIIIGDLPTIEAIPLQMAQLFGNLVSNALKFSKDDGNAEIKIQSKLLVRADYFSYYRITVADNGIGFEPEHAEKIFQIFQRLHGRSEYAGTGIGLAICKKIVENHHGEISASAVQGKAAVFAIVLPASQSTF